MEFHTGLFGLGWEPQPMQGAFIGGTGTQNLIFGYPESVEKWVQMLSRTRGFCIFLPNLMFFSTLWSLMLHFDKSSNMAKICQKLKKSLVRLALKMFFLHGNAGS